MRYGRSNSQIISTVRVLVAHYTAWCKLASASPAECATINIPVSSCAPCQIGRYFTADGRYFVSGMFHDDLVQLDAEKECGQGYTRHLLDVNVDEQA